MCLHGGLLFLETIFTKFIVPLCEAVAGRRRDVAHLENNRVGQTSKAWKYTALFLARSSHLVSKLILNENKNAVWHLFLLIYSSGQSGGFFFGSISDSMRQVGADQLYEEEKNTTTECQDQVHILRQERRIQITAIAKLQCACIDSRSWTCQ